MLPLIVTSEKYVVKLATEKLLFIYLKQILFCWCKHINSVNININNDFTNENMLSGNISSLMLYM